MAVHRIWNGSAWVDVVSAPSNMSTTDTAQNITGLKTVSGFANAGLSVNVNAATRQVGGTTSGAPVAGTWNKGDEVTAQDGHKWICTAAGTPGTWRDVGVPTTGSTGTVLTSDPNAATGQSFTMSPVSSGGISNKKFMGAYVNVGATTISVFGMPSFTPAATLANADDTVAPYLRQTSGAITGNSTGSATSNVTMRQFLGEYYARVKTGANVGNVRLWHGLFNGAPEASATPALHIAAFRYDTTADGTAFWRCVTAAGTSTQTVTATAAAIAVSTANDFGVVMSASDVKFYIDNLLVATHTTNIPTASATMAGHIKVTTTAALAKEILWSKIELRSL